MAQSNTGSADITGNAGTATALQTARLINGVSFNGTADITNIAEATNAATSKATPVDADVLPLADSAASFVLKKLTWGNLKATLKTYFDALSAATLYTSADQTITAAGLLTLPHGLASTPHHIHFVLVNVTAELNYTTGQILPLDGFAQGNNQGISCVPDATNLVLRYGSSATVFSIMNKTTGAISNITPANWKLRVYASLDL
jgi:hypothetical protein